MCPGVPYNHVLEDWFMVNPEKIADAHPQARGLLRSRGTRAARHVGGLLDPQGADGGH